MRYALETPMAYTHSNLLGHHTMLELAFSWLASRPQVASVIAGATRLEQVEQNVKAIGWALSAEEIAEIDRMTKG